MLKVSFKITHPTMDFDQILQALPAAYQGSDYETRMQENIKNGILLSRQTQNVNGEYIHYTIWKDRASNEAWTQSIYNSPSTKKFYDNLTEMGFVWTVVKEDI